MLRGSVDLDPTGNTGVQLIDRFADVVVKAAQALLGRRENGDIAELAFTEGSVFDEVHLRGKVSLQGVAVRRRKILGDTAIRGKADDAQAGAVVLPILRNVVDGVLPRFCIAQLDLTGSLIVAVDGVHQRVVGVRGAALGIIRRDSRLIRRPKAGGALGLKVEVDGRAAHTLAARKQYARLPVRQCQLAAVVVEPCLELRRVGWRKAFPIDLQVLGRDKLGALCRFTGHGLLDGLKEVRQLFRCSPLLAVRCDVALRVVRFTVVVERVLLIRGYVVKQSLQRVVLGISQGEVSIVVNAEKRIEVERDLLLRGERIEVILHMGRDLQAVLLHEVDELLHSALVAGLLVRGSRLLQALQGVKQLHDLLLLVVPQVLIHIVGVRAEERVAQQCACPELGRRLNGIVRSVQRILDNARNVETVFIHQRNDGVQRTCVLCIRRFGGELDPLLYIVLGELRSLVGARRARRGAIQLRRLTALYVVAVPVESGEPDFFSAISRSSLRLYFRDCSGVSRSRERRLSFSAISSSSLRRCSFSVSSSASRYISRPLFPSRLAFSIISYRSIVGSFLSGQLKISLCRLISEVVDHFKVYPATIRQVAVDRTGDRLLVGKLVEVEINLVTRSLVFLDPASQLLCIVPKNGEDNVVIVRQHLIQRRIRDALGLLMNEPRVRTVILRNVGPNVINVADASLMQRGKTFGVDRGLPAAREADDDVHAALLLHGAVVLRVPVCVLAGVAAAAQSVLPGLGLNGLTVRQIRGLCTPAVLTLRCLPHLGNGHELVEARRLAAADALDDIAGLFTQPPAEADRAFHRLLDHLVEGLCTLPERVGVVEDVNARIGVGADFLDDVRIAAVRPAVLRDVARDHLAQLGLPMLGNDLAHRVCEQLAVLLREPVEILVLRETPHRQLIMIGLYPHGLTIWTDCRASIEAAAFPVGDIQVASEVVYRDALRPIRIAYLAHFVGVQVLRHNAKRLLLRASLNAYFSGAPFCCDIASISDTISEVLCSKPLGASPRWSLFCPSRNAATWLFGSHTVCPLRLCTATLVSFSAICRVLLIICGLFSPVNALLCQLLIEHLPQGDVVGERLAELFAQRLHELLKLAVGHRMIHTLEGDGLLGPGVHLSGILLVELPHDSIAYPRLALAYQRGKRLVGDRSARFRDRCDRRCCLCALLRGLCRHFRRRGEITLGHSLRCGEGLFCRGISAFPRGLCHALYGGDPLRGGELIVVRGQRAAQELLEELAHGSLRQVQLVDVRRSDGLTI